MKRRRNWLLGVALSLVLLVPLGGSALADGPAPPPHSFYGTLTMNGSDIPAGAEVVAVVEGGGGSIITTVDGQYGSPPFDYLAVSGYIERGAIIEFYVDGDKANETFPFKSGTIKNLDLTVPGVPPETFTITATAGAGGSISPPGAVVVNSGADQEFTITPDLGYVVEDVLVDGGSVGAVTSYTFTNVTADHTIDASFVLGEPPETFTITATAGAGGAIEPSGEVVVNSGASQAFTITPDTGYGIHEVLVDDVSVGAVTSYTFADVTANHTIHASFAAVETFTITATAGTGGAIEPSGEVVVNSGASQAFTITPDTGYVVDDVLVDGASVGAVSSHTFENVTANHTIDASFAEGTTFTTTLSGGWNLLSTPIKLDTDSDAFEQIFDAQSLANILIVYSWDGVSQQWAPVLTGYELLPLYAIYVKVKSDASAMAVFIPSQELSWPPSRDLEPGLNLIGPAPALVEGGLVMPLDEALISIEEAEGGLRGYTMVVSPAHNQPPWAYALGMEVRDLIPFKGYWVVMENADTLYGFSTTPLP